MLELLALIICFFFYFAPLFLFWYRGTASKEKILIKNRYLNTSLVGLIVRLAPAISMTILLGLVVLGQMATLYKVLVSILLIGLLLLTIPPLFFKKLRGNLATPIQGRWSVGFLDRERVSLHIKGTEELDAHDLNDIIDELKKIEGLKKIELTSHLLYSKTKGFGYRFIFKIKPDLNSESVKHIGNRKAPFLVRIKVKRLLKKRIIINEKLLKNEKDESARLKIEKRLLRSKVKLCNFEKKPIESTYTIDLRQV